MGTPSKIEWPDGYRLAERRGYNFPKIKGKGLKKLINNASSDAIDFMLSTLKYDAKKRPTASELLKHSFFRDHTISKDVYEYANSKKLSKLDLKKKGSDLESLKISPNGIVIEKQDSVDNSPFNLDKYKYAMGLKSGFELRKPEDNVPKLIQKPSYGDLLNHKEIRRKSMHEYGLLKHNVLQMNSEEIKPPYYQVEERRSDPNDFKTRIQEPIYPYYKKNDDIFNDIKIPTILLDERNLYIPKHEKLVERDPFKVSNSKINLAQPALITSDANRGQKTHRKYKLEFKHRRKEGEEGEKVRPTDGFARKVLNVQQSLPELPGHKTNQQALER
jgi:serine/threonine protein kinase